MYCIIAFSCVIVLKLTAYRGHHGGQDRCHLHFVGVLKKVQLESQEEVSHKLSQLEDDVTVNQDSAAQSTAKMNCEWALEFQKKGHERHYQFTEVVRGHSEGTSRLLSKMKPANEGDEMTVKAAREELSQGVKMLVTRQKLIHIVDQCDFGWQVVEA